MSEGERDEGSVELADGMGLLSMNHWPTGLVHKGSVHDVGDQRKRGVDHRSKRKELGTLGYGLVKAGMTVETEAWS